LLPVAITALKANWFLAQIGTYDTTLSCACCRTVEIRQILCMLLHRDLSGLMSKRTNRDESEQLIVVVASTLSGGHFKIKFENGHMLEEAM